jgi:hypothetical protein
MPQRLLWLVYKNGSRKQVIVYPASDVSFARLTLSMSGYKGQFLEGHPLPPDFKMPKGKIGKPMSAKEAEQLLG